MDNHISPFFSPLHDASDPRDGGSGTHIVGWDNLNELAFITVVDARYQEEPLWVIC